MEGGSQSARALSTLPDCCLSRGPLQALVPWTALLAMAETLIRSERGRYSGTSTIRNSAPLEGPYSRNMPRALWRP